MVVVEGVARSLNPQMNIWHVAAPVVTDYITKSIGPKAVVNDLAKAARVLSRFGPRLPSMIEAALLRQADALPPAPKPFKRYLVLAAIFGAAVATGLIMLVEALS